MALISCPNCKNPVSDKAVACPNCGYTITLQSADVQNKIKCEDCGNEFENSLAACPVCGCPSPAAHSKTFGKGRKSIIISATLIVLFIIVFFGITASKKAMLAQYSANLSEVSQTMLDGSAKAEKAGNLIKTVWYNAIYEEQDEETDRFTMENGKFVDDFNDALNNLFSDDDFSTNIYKIRKNQTKVTDLMKKLKNPPENYKEAYSALREYYDNYLKITNITINPTGSYNSFTKNFNKYDESTVNAYKKLELYLD